MPRSAPYHPRVRVPRRTLVPIAAIGLVGACEATGELSGAEPRFDLTVPCFADPRGTPEEQRDAGSGATFDDLYRDFFGPGVESSCSRDTFCHGSSDARGARTSGGFVCSAEGGPIACRQSMLDHLLDRTAATPDDTRLMRVLRHRDDCGLVGIMPARATDAKELYVFSKADRERIRTWIRSELGQPAGDAGGD